jgi:hypothetical protein
MPTALERSGQYGQDTLDQGAKLGAPHAGQDRLGEQFSAALGGCRVDWVPRCSKSRWAAWAACTPGSIVASWPVSRRPTSSWPLQTRPSKRS